MSPTKHFFFGAAASVLCLLALGPIPAAHANLLTNPGFETNSGIPGSSIPPAPSGWSASGDGMYLDNSSPHSGNYDIGFSALSTDQSPGILSQTVATTPGQAYSLSFWLLDPGPLPGADAFDVAFGGFNTSVAGSSASPSYTNITIGILGSDVTGAATTLRFQGLLDQSGSTAAVFLDDVSLTASTPVPEPSTLALFGAGLGGLALVVWEKKRKAVAFVT